MPENDGIAWQVPTYDDRRHKCAVCGRGWASKTAAAFCCEDDD